MGTPAHVQSIAALEELRGALLRFKSEAQNALNAAEIEVKRTRDWLQERLQSWQYELKRRRRALEEAQAALRACEAMAMAAAIASAGNAAPDCSPFAAAVMRAKRRVEEAEQELRVVQEYMKRVEEAIASYQQQARQLAQMLENDLLKGADFLSESVTILLSYASAGAGAGIAAVIGSALDVLSGGSSDSSIPEGANAEAGNPKVDPIYISCPQCGGSGSEDVECNPCGGKGHRFDGSECPHCRGLGMKAITCLRCEGTGSVLEEMK